MTAAVATEMMTVDQVAALFHVSGQTVLDWMRDGKLPRPIRLGRRWLWKAEDIEAHLEKLKE